MNPLSFHRGEETWKTKTTAQSTSDLPTKHQTSDISLKTSNMMLKHQKWQRCYGVNAMLIPCFLLLLSMVI